MIQSKIEHDIRLLKDRMIELDRTFDSQYRQYMKLKQEVQKLQTLLYQITYNEQIN